MKFETGKCYEHNGLQQVKILGKVNTTMYGDTLIAERPDGYFYAVGNDEASAVNWHEIPETEWMKNFS